MRTMIRTLRESRGWTQTELGERAGLRQASVSKAERRPDAVEVETMALIAQALGVSLADLFAPDPHEASLAKVMGLAAQLSPEDRAVLERAAEGMVALNARSDKAQG